jgi:hypothetical protein
MGDRTKISARRGFLGDFDIMGLPHQDEFADTPPPGGPGNKEFLLLSAARKSEKR